MLTAPILMLAAGQYESPLHLAWRHTGEFWAQTGAAIAHHPLPILLCAAVPAVERAYTYLYREHTTGAGPAVLEALVTLWRVLLCVVAAWAATSGVEWRTLRQQMSAMAAWQVGLTEVGAHFAHHLRMVLWEFLFLAIVLCLAHWIFSRCVRSLAGAVPWLREPRHRIATMSILRNLIFAPVLVIYLVEMARPAFQ